jgi:hypothetical protein
MLIIHGYLAFISFSYRETNFFKVAGLEEIRRTLYRYMSIQILEDDRAENYKWLWYIIIYPIYWAPFTT